MRKESEGKVSKTCPRCGKTNSQDLYNGFWHCRECCKIFSFSESVCADVARLKEVSGGKTTDEIKQTVFQKITGTPKALAPYCICIKPSINGETLYYYSTVTGDIYLTKAEAITATIKELEKVIK